LFGESNRSLAQAIAEVISVGIKGGTIAPVDNASGQPPRVPKGETGEYVQSKPGVSVLPPHYDDIVVSATSATITVTGDPNERVLVGSGSLAFYEGGAPHGSGTIAGGGGNNLINIPGSDKGDWLIALGNGNNTVDAAGRGSDTISTGTGHNLIHAGVGHSVIVTAGTDTITAGGSDTVFAGGSDLIYGGKRLFFVGGGGSTVFGGAGSDTLSGGTGPDLFIGGSAGHNLITAGTGLATLVGSASGDQLFANGADPQILYAGGGRETLSGANASGADTFVGGSGKDLIIGNTTNDTFLAGSGNETITASPTAGNVFEFIYGQAGGKVLVQDLFSATQVSLDLEGYGGASPTQTLTKGGLVVSLSDGTQITFQNIHSDITKITSH
jgi:Ca2+-binding RTX toxin-like protein